jgi:DNA-binding response OmpR family regulator
LCRELRADPATTAIGVILLTARAEPDDRITGLEVGADDYVGQALRRARGRACG